MTLIDRVEMLGTAVDAGLIDRDAAAELLAEYSAGGYTKSGALRALADHRHLRQRRNESLAGVQSAIDALQAVRTAETLEEFLAAHDAMLAEMSRQRKAHLGQVKERIRDNIRRGNGAFGGGPDAKEA